MHNAKNSAHWLKSKPLTNRIILFTIYAHDVICFICYASSKPLQTKLFVDTTK